MVEGRDLRYTRLKYTKACLKQPLQQVEDVPSPSRARVGLLVALLVSSGVALPLYAFGVAHAVPSTRLEVLGLGVAGFAGPSQVAATVGVTAKGDASFAGGPHTISLNAAHGVVSQFMICDGGARLASSPDGSPVVHSAEGVFDIAGGAAVGGSSKHAVFVMTSIVGSGPFAFQGPAKAATGPEVMLGVQPYPGTSGLTSAVPKPWSDFFQRRSKFEIYVEILEVMKRGPMTPFEVAFYARLNHKRTKEYTEFLASSGYLHPVTEDGKTVYVLTKEGAGFLEGVRSLFVRTRLIEVASYALQRDF